MKAVIERYSHGEKQTLGNWFTLDANNEVVYNCETLEPAWENNQRNISCIPQGTYKVKKRHSQRFKHHFHITDVEGRDWILVHAGNFRKDTRGCVLVGSQLTDINADGLTDVLNSQDTLADLLGVMPSEFELKIVDC